MSIIERKQGGYRLRIERDDDPAMSPRDWDDNVGTIVSLHPRYNLGDQGAPAIPRDDLSTWDDVEEHLREEHGAVVTLPVYLYDHSGIAISTSPFGCPWDSGRVGTIYATREAAERLLGEVSTEAIERALRAEIEVYDRFVQGDVYYFEVVDERGDVVDSCGGFYDLNDADAEGTACLRAHAERTSKPCSVPAPACA